MRKNLKSGIIAMALVLIVGGINAQDYTFMYVNYNPSFTTGDSKAWANEFSWRGFTADLRIPINGALTAGIYSGWTVFREEVIRSGLQTEVQFRLIVIWEIMRLRFYFQTKILFY